MVGYVKLAQYIPISNVMDFQFGRELPGILCQPF